MILTRNMFIDFSCYFDIEQGHSDRFKWCIVQREASTGKPRSEMGYRFSGSGLKKGYRFSGSGLKRRYEKSYIWSEIGSGF